MLLILHLTKKAQAKHVYTKKIIQKKFEGNFFFHNLYYLSSISKTIEIVKDKNSMYNRAISSDASKLWLEILYSNKIKINISENNNNNNKPRVKHKRVNKY